MQDKGSPSPEELEAMADALLGGSGESNDLMDRGEWDDQAPLYGNEGEVVGQLPGFEEEDFYQGSGEVGTPGTHESLQLERFSHMEPRVQATIKGVLDGSLSAHEMGVSQLSLDSAREQFRDLTGTDPRQVAARMPRIPEGVQPTRLGEERAMVLRMLGEGGREYEQRGPGQSLPDNTHSNDGERKLRDELKRAFDGLDTLADSYLHDRTKESRIYPIRKKAVVDALAKRFMDGVMYEGSAAELPLPNELGVKGVKPTQSFRGFGGSPFTRLGWALRLKQAGKDEIGGDLTGKVIRPLDPDQEWTLAPDLKGSLVGKAKYGDDHDRRTKDYEFKQLRELATEVRKTLRKHMPTNRDESAGQIRMAGFDRPYDEQAEQADLANEAALLDLDYNGSMDADTVGKRQALRLPQEQALKLLKWGRAEGAGLEGADRSGGFGYRTMSDRARYLEARAAGLDEEAAYEVAQEGVPTNKYLEAMAEEVKEGGAEPRPEPTTDEERYLRWVEDNKPPEQRSPEWFALRKGIVTASKFNDAKTPEALAIMLAKERLGYDSFEGNDYTNMGGKYEDSVANAFLSGPGKGLRLHEAYLETGGVTGASPDGRLFDENGNSAGLAEFKYLTKTKGSERKYYDQMQIQMAKTGETQTHFYAEDRYTGGGYYRLVKADKDRQDELERIAEEALVRSNRIKTAADLDREIIRMKYESRKRRKAESAASKAGPVRESYAKGRKSEPEPEQEPISFAEMMANGMDPAERFNTTVDHKPELDQGDLNLQAIAKDALNRETAMLKEAYARNRHVTQERAGQSKQHKDMLSEAYARNKFIDEEKKVAENQEQKSLKEMADAAKQATDRLDGFGRKLKQAISALGEVGGALMSGNGTGMDEVRRAARAGVDVEHLRGARWALQKGGLDDAGINSAVGGLSSLVKSLNDDTLGPSEYVRIMKGRGAANTLPEVKAASIPGYRELTRMSTLDLAQFVTSTIHDFKDPEAKAQFANLFGAVDLAAYQGDEDLSEVTNKYIHEQKLRETYKGVTEVMQTKQTAMEQLGQVGGTGGAVGAGAVVASGVAGTATAGLLTKAAAGKIKKVQAAKAAAAQAGERAAGMKAATTSGSRALGAAARVGSGLTRAASLARASLPGLAVTGASMATRAVGDIKDDGGVGDTIMDLVEDAANGAAAGGAVGAFAGGIGAIPGAIVGGGLGLGAGIINEAAQALGWWGGDSEAEEGVAGVSEMPVPKPTISKASASGGRSVNVENNVKVNVEVSKDLVKTDVDANGEHTFFETTELNTGE